VFTYYLRDSLETSAAKRREAEKALDKAGRDIPFPGWDALESEKREETPQIWLTIRDGEGNVVRRVAGPTKAGFHRVAWDLRYPAPEAVRVDAAASESGGGEPEGLMAAPGAYSVTLSKSVGGVVTPLSDPQTFEVVPLRRGALEGAPYEEVAAFWREFEDVTRKSSAVQIALSEALKRAAAMRTVLSRTPAAPGELDRRLHSVRQSLLELDGLLYGLASKREVGEKTKPTIGSRLLSVNLGIGRSTYGPTPTHRQILAIAESDLSALEERLTAAQAELSDLADALVRAGAPWIEGERLPE
jgi:hypothetical protein